LYHVTARGNARQDIYLHDADRRNFLGILGHTCRRANWLCHAYCMMSNHYHLVVETPDANLSRGMRQLNGIYTQAFNRAHGRVGHVFQGRYKAILVDREAYLSAVCRYVVLNPVRAGMVRHPREWPWSSYRATVGEAEPPAWLAADRVLARFGGSKRRARAAFAAFVLEGRGAPSLWEHLRQQIYLGSERFVHETQGRIDQARDLSEVPRRQHMPVPQPLAWYAASTADRHEAMARAYRSGTHSLAQIAHHFGVHYSTVSRAVRRFEQDTE